MRFCQNHWDDCREAIKVRGLGHLVPKSGSDALKRLVAEVEGTDTPSTYDPLMALHWMISGQALKMGGLYLMMEKEDGGQYCPLCELEINNGSPQEWINGAADAVLEYCKENNLQG